METRTLCIAATLVAGPEEVFGILVSSEKHSAVTGAPPR